MTSEVISDLAKQIEVAFENLEYPGDWCIRGGNEGSEAYDVEKDFKGKTKWQEISSNFLDQSPNGLGSSLSFFSDEAFRFYLPAYLIADLKGELSMQEPVFQLTHSLTNSAKTELVNPRRFGERTWFDYGTHRYSIFSKSQAQAIVGYLRYKATRDEFSRTDIEEALKNFWLDKAKENK